MKEVLIRQMKRASDPQRAVSLMCDCSRSEHVQHTNTDQRRDVKQVQSLQCCTEEEDEDGYLPEINTNVLFSGLQIAVYQKQQLDYLKLNHLKAFFGADLSHDITNNKLLNYRQQMFIQSRCRNM